MITNKLIKKVEDFVYEESEKHGAPSEFVIKLSNEKGQFLAEKLGANKKIVLLGTLLMDCKLGKAFKENKVPNHIEMSMVAAKELLVKDKAITDKEKNIVLNCVLQHHGSKKFYSLESEIVCNADCYRFLSVKGVFGQIRTFFEIPYEDMVKIFLDKVDEKWKALSLDICKRELKPQYKAIKSLLNEF
ncbi:hypothetical protein A2Z22_05085 [Candidatus Woesebacteria bacterium RBG_16_34_12]|uniref:HD domain-containing protein n=1 Tax=Candidatus Woesebacteria bacterium RBG_16_34_12 TaxID=1802480 RepID=A0A1F7X8N0_9BACT|nr:MAG: hypothetical protein A2Z22_05085 [Candidatus Woesebacteria bacterium RBG_16_34_12]